MFDFSLAKRTETQKSLFNNYGITLLTFISQLTIIIMKNENTIGGTTLAVAPSVTSRHSSLRNSSQREAAAAAIVDASLIKEEEEEEDVLAEEEEKLILEEDDEEVTSMESNEMNHHPDGEELDDPDVVVEQEDASLQVALMESVLKAHKGSGAVGDRQNSSTTMGLKQRLRKSPRRSGQDLERLERNQVSLDGGLASRKRGGMAISSSVPNPLSDQSLQATPTTTSSSIHFRNPNPIPIKSTTTATKIELAAPAKADFPIPVPCPLPAIAESEPDHLRKVNFCESVTGGGRFRGFSMDLDSKSLLLSSSYRWCARVASLKQSLTHRAGSDFFACWLTDSTLYFLLVSSCRGVGNVV
jgi:hypothetical protein